MNIDRKLETIRIINNVLLVSLVFSVVVMCFQITTFNMAFLGSVPVVIFLLLSEAIRRRVQNLIAFLLMHLLGAALPIYAAYVMDLRYYAGRDFGGIYVSSVMLSLRILTAVIIVLLAIYSRVEDKDRFYPEISEAFVFFALFALSLITHQKQVLAPILIGEAVWAVLCMLFYNLKQTNNALVIWKNKDYVPYDAIGNNNRLMMGASIIISLICIAVGIFFDYGKEILSAIKRGLVTALRWLFSHFQFEETIEYEDPVSEPMSGGGLGGLIPPAEQDTSIWHTLWNVLFWIVAAVVTVFIIYLVIIGIREFYRFFNSKGMGLRDKLHRDKREFLSPIRKEENAFETKPERITLRKRLTPEGRIRYMFVKYIKKSIDASSILGSDTPMQMESKTHNTTAASTLYEKARYSTEPITKQDLDTMKNLSRS